MARTIPTHRSGGGREKGMRRPFEHLGKGYQWRPSWCPVWVWQYRIARRAVKALRRG